MFKMTSLNRPLLGLLCLLAAITASSRQTAPKTPSAYSIGRPACG
jgi:hypothetical protein